MDYWHFSKTYNTDTLEYQFRYDGIRFRAVIFKSFRGIAQLVLEFVDSNDDPLDITEDKDIKALMDFFEKNKTKYASQLLASIED